MNQGHMEFCTSSFWKEILEQQILPNTLGTVDLGPEVIEIGPGPGFTTETLLAGGAAVTAVEIDPVLLGQLTDRLGDRVDVVLGDARDTGLDADSFSGAASFHMLHHVPTDEDQDAIFAELHRVLRPGGVALLADSMESEEVRQGHVDDIYNPIDPELLPKRLTRAGFTEVEVGQHDLGWFCTARVGSTNG
jgi:SAM-dependent methyltransferase